MVYSQQFIYDEKLRLPTGDEPPISHRNDLTTSNAIENHFNGLQLTHNSEWVKYKYGQNTAGDDLVYFCLDDIIGKSTDANGVVTYDHVYNFDRVVQFTMPLERWTGLGMVNGRFLRDVSTLAIPLALEDAAVYPLGTYNQSAVDGWKGDINYKFDGNHVYFHLDGSTYKMAVTDSKAISIFPGLSMLNGDDGKQILNTDDIVGYAAMTEAEKLAAKRAAIAAHVIGWAGLTSDQKDAKIAAAIATEIDESGVRFLVRYTIPGSNTTIEFLRSDTANENAYDVDVFNEDPDDTKNNHIEVDGTGIVNEIASSSANADKVLEIKALFDDIKCSDLKGLGNLGDYEDLFEATTALQGQALQATALNGELSQLMEFNDTAAAIGDVLSSMTAQIKSVTEIDDTAMLDTVKVFATSLKSAMVKLKDFRLTIKATHNISIPKSFSDVATYLDEAKMEVSCLKTVLAQFSKDSDDATIDGYGISTEMLAEKNEAIAALKMLKTLGSTVSTDVQNDALALIKQKANEISSMKGEFDSVKVKLMDKWAALQTKHVFENNTTNNNPNMV